MSNIYFLIIAVFQCFKEISNANGRPIILMPLAIIVAVNGVKWAVNNCVIQGNGDYLSPKASCTRAQAANIVQRFCEMFGLLK